MYCRTNAHRLAAPAKKGYISAVKRLSDSIHLRLSQPFRHHIEKRGNTFGIPHGDAPVHLHQRKQPRSAYLGNRHGRHAAWVLGHLPARRRNAAAAPRPDSCPTASPRSRSPAPASRQVQTRPPQKPPSTQSCSPAAGDNPHAPFPRHWPHTPPSSCPDRERKRLRVACAGC